MKNHKKKQLKDENIQSINHRVRKNVPIRILRRMKKEIMNKRLKIPWKRKIQRLTPQWLKQGKF